MSIAWTDGVTPLNAANMVQLVQENEIVAAATKIMENKLAGGDAQPAFRILGDGKHEWGPGGSTAPDTQLWRSAASTLRTGGTLSLPRVAFPYDGAGGDIVLGGDANLYRSAASTVKTDGALHVNGLVAAGISPTTGQVLIGAQGPGNEAGFRLGASADTNLYRKSAANLQTDGNLWINNTAVIGTNGSGYLAMRHNSTPSIYFGTADDVRLYRYGPAQLKIDGNLYLSEQIVANIGTSNQIAVGHNGASVSAGFYFGSAADTNLYRTGAGNLTTDGTFNAVGDLNTTGWTGRASLDTGLGVNPQGVGARRVNAGAADSGGSGYRMLRVPN